jgi:hypothetical protein
LAACVRFLRGLTVGHFALARDTAAPSAFPCLSPRLPLAESKEQRKMKWLKKVRDPERDVTPKQTPTPKEEIRKEVLRIEELEERITPNAVWSD